MNIFRRIKWAYQRVVRGWDDTAMWDVDGYLSDTIIAVLTKFKKEHQGVPSIMFTPEECRETDGDIDEQTTKKRRIEYDALIQEIIDGFKAYRDTDGYCGTMEGSMQEKFDRAFTLLHDYFPTFWD